MIILLSFYTAYSARVRVRCINYKLNFIHLIISKQFKAREENPKEFTMK